MTDRFKGVLVTFEREIREDDAEKYIDAIKMIKGVHKVEPYINGAEDWMMYEKGCYDTTMSFYKWVAEAKDKKNPA